MGEQQQGKHRAKHLRVVLSKPLPGELNMALDALAGKGLFGLPFLRLYRWDKPTVSIGRHQNMDAVDENFCKLQGVPVVKRPTGGRALLHDQEVTYCIAVEPGNNLPTDLPGLFKRISEAICNALRQLGIPAELFEGKPSPKYRGPKGKLPCFWEPSTGEITAFGKKLVASAALLSDGIYLQHGTIPLLWNSKLAGRCLGLNNLKAEALSDYGITDWDSVARTLVQEFARVLRLEPLMEALTPTEFYKAEEISHHFLVHLANAGVRGAQL